MRLLKNMNIFILTFHKYDKAFASDLYLIYNRSPAARVCKSDTDRLLMLYLVLRLESTRRGESTNFKHQNNIENKVYLTDFCRYQQIFSSSTTTLEILQENFNINIFFRFIFRRMQIFLSKFCR